MISCYEKMMKMPLGLAIALHSALVEVLKMQSELIGPEQCNLLDRHVKNLQILIIAGKESPHFKDGERIIGMQNSSAYNLYHEIDRIHSLLINAGVEPSLDMTEFIENEAFKHLPKPKAWDTDDIFDKDIDFDSIEERFKKRDKSLTDISSITGSDEEEDWDAEFQNTPGKTPK